MLGNEILEDDHVIPLPLLASKERQSLLAEAKNLFTHQGNEKAERHLLKSFHQFDLGDGTSYDLLIDFHHGMGFRSREEYWIGEQITRVYNRDKLDPETAVENMRGTLFSNPHAKISDLPQFRIFQKVMQTCRSYPGLEQVYVRGSLARGDPDPHSDIDLLCVVSPQSFGAFIKQADAGIKEQHNPVTDGWIDTIVPDFGGVGLVYLIETEGGLYQLDLYVACQGHPSLERLAHVPYKQEIFRQNRKEGGSHNKDALRYRVHANSVELQIQQFNSVETTVARTLVELNVLGFMLKKCIKRGDGFVAEDRFHMWKECFIKLIRHRFDTAHLHYGFYHVKRLITEANDNGVLYEDLRAINSNPPTAKNFVSVHRYAMKFLQEHFPEDYTDHIRLIRVVTEHIEDRKPGPLLSPLSPARSSSLALQSPIIIEDLESNRGKKRARRGFSRTSLPPSA